MNDYRKELDDRITNLLFQASVVDRFLNSIKDIYFKEEYYAVVINELDLVKIESLYDFYMEKLDYLDELIETLTDELADSAEFDTSNNC